MLSEESTEARLARIETKLDSIVQWLVNDHESRIRKLEKWRWSLPPALILAVASIAISVAAVLVRLV